MATYLPQAVTRPPFQKGSLTAGDSAASILHVLLPNAWFVSAWVKWDSRVALGPPAAHQPLRAYEDPDKASLAELPFLVETAGDVPDLPVI